MKHYSVLSIISLLAISSAAYKGNDKIVDLMLDKWGDVKKTANDGTTVLHAAAVGGNRRIVQKVIATLFVVSNTEAIRPQRQFSIYMIFFFSNKLIDKWAEVNAVTKDGVTPLMNAVLNNHRDVVEVGLKNSYFFQVAFSKCLIFVLFCL